ncbi:MAG: winged helix-turn-helix transcriptional regulator, partial [Bacteroidetes bacterium]
TRLRMGSIEVDVGIVAVIFTGLGVWISSALRKPQRKNPEDTDEPFQPNQKIITELGLTEREMEILELIAEGHSNQEIAGKLFISLSTVKTHCSNIFSKLDVKRRTQAIQKAKELGVIL